MKVRVLGCGTSTGVPRIVGDWGRCDPSEPRNRRTRSSIAIESGGQWLLIDCGPDMRQQLLAAEINRISGVVITHDHADHCHGIDDLRPLAQANKSPLPVYGRSETLAQVRARFSYAFAQSGFYPPVVDPVEVGSALDHGEGVVRFVDQPHGRIRSLGLRMDEGGRSVSYAIDFHELTDEMASLYQGSDVWIADCLTRRPHPSHAHLDAVIGWARDLRVGQLYLSHMGNDMDYRTLVSELPDWAAPAHDGLELAL